MKSQIVLVAVACGLLSGCGDNSKSKSSGTVGENPLNAPADYVGAIGKAQKAAVKTLGAVSLDSAIKTFYEQENRYPKTLDELTPKYVSKIPDAPLGYKINYDAAKGEVSVVRQ